MSKLKLYRSPLDISDYFSVPWTKTKIQSIHIAVEQVKYEYFSPKQNRHEQATRHPYFGWIAGIALAA